jgi:Tfp pilus assembly protein PilO
VRGQLVEKKKDLAFERRELELLDQLVQDKMSSDLQIEKALSFLPQTYLEVGALAYKIENRARDNGLSSEISFDKEAKEEGEIAGLTIMIKTQGGYQNYTNFVSNLSNLPYNTEFKSIAFTNEDGISAETTVKVFIKK